jgi:hypothetical protein
MDEVTEIGTTDAGDPVYRTLRKTRHVGDTPIQHPNLTTAMRIMMEVGNRLTDWQLTPKSAADTDQPEGYFDPVEEDTLEEHLRKRNLLIEEMHDQIEAANRDLSDDPILIEHLEDRDQT